MCLTNIHICMHPLRDADGENYQNLRNKWFTIGEVGIKKGKLLRHAIETSAKSDSIENLIVHVIFWTQRQIMTLKF